MNRKLLSLVTSASLLVSTLSLGAAAVPSAVATGDSSLEYIPEIPVEDTIEVSGSEDSVSFPKAVELADSAEELNVEYGKPHLSDAQLLSELDGEGTAESPYLISDASGLFSMANNINTGTASDAYYKLTADIDLGGAEWTPAGYYDKSLEDAYSTAFRGVFDGDGHTVSNFKITTADTSYIGFFGLVYGGSVKNFNVSNAEINVSTENNERFYTGIIAARFVVNEENKTAVIENCHVTESSVYAITNGTIYAGGIAGSVYALNNSNCRINVYFTTAECDIFIKSTATSKLDSSFQLAVAGGLIGYLGSETNSGVAVLNCSANADVHTDTLSTYLAIPIAGGLFGDLHIYDNTAGGTATVSACYSEGTVVTESQKAYLAGGFSGQIYANPTTYINDCYSSSDVSGVCEMKVLYPNEDSAAGGFVGVIGYPGFQSYFEKQIINCYASGDAIDSTHTETSPANSSYANGFAGWTDAGMFKNCYKFESQTVIASNLPAEAVTTLSEEKAVIPEYYTGFDFTNTWQIDPSAEYHYPTLREKTGYVDFYANGVIYTTGTFGSNGKVTAPSDIPEKAPTVDKTYTFIYWSSTENGSPFDFANTVLTDNTNLYAVFTEADREYKINFVSDGIPFVAEQSIVYGSHLKAPLTKPEKADTEQYYYVFLYWSATEGGEAYDFTDAVVKQDMTFHAVYNEIDKSAWTGGVADSFASGFGTQELPYIISTADEFALFAKVINENATGYTDAYYALGNDINLGGNYWASIGTKAAPFSANFDGNGYRISNFKLSSSQYAGLFGYVLNAVIKNVYVSDFTIALSPVLDTNKYVSETDSSGNTIYSTYVGGLAGYIDSKSGTSEISGIRVTCESFTVNTSFKGYIYAGNIAGYINSGSRAHTLVTDSFSTSAISVKNTGGYAFVGGITGRASTKSGGLSQIIRCYNTGEITAASYNSSYAGGLVGYLWSNGTDFVGPSSEDSADLSATEDDDTDAMLVDSFAAANVTANSSAYTSYSGRLVGSVNPFAGIVDSFYPRGSVITVTPAENPVNGYSTELSNLQSRDWLENNRGFDFENTWTFVSESSYPVLKCMVSDKPVLKIVSTSLSDGTLDAAIQVLSKEQSYTLVVGVYNARNQLIRFERINFENSDYLNEVDVSYENVKGAKYISVSAVETTSLKPLFSEITKNI